MSITKIPLTLLNAIILQRRPSFDRGSSPLGRGGGGYNRSNFGADLGGMAPSGDQSIRRDGAGDEDDLDAMISNLKVYFVKVLNETSNVQS